MKHLLLSVLILGAGTVSVTAQEPQFTFSGGSVQIGSAPGRVDMARPTVRTVTLGTRVQFAFRVAAPEGSDPCAGGQQCQAVVGLRSHNDSDIPFTEVWSTYTLPVGISGPLALDLSSTAPTNALPKGNCDLLVRIARGTSIVFEYLVPVVVQ